MADEQVRLEILSLLKEIFDKQPYQSTSKDQLLKALSVSENVLDRNIKYLDDSGLISTEYFLGGVYFTQITNFGIDELEHKGTSRVDRSSIPVVGDPQKYFIDQAQKKAIVSGILFTIIIQIIVNYKTILFQEPVAIQFGPVIISTLLFGYMILIACIFLIISILSFGYELSTDINRTDFTKAIHDVSFRFSILLVTLYLFPLALFAMFSVLGNNFILIFLSLVYAGIFVFLMVTKFGSRLLYFLVKTFRISAFISRLRRTTEKIEQELDSIEKEERDNHEK